jgi:hypothetical protein
MDYNKFDWYQCDILKKDGTTDFWCRFIAKSEEDAKVRIQRVLKSALTGSLKNRIYQLISKRYIRDYKIFRVPENILKRYNFRTAKETDAFYCRAKG